MFHTTHHRGLWGWGITLSLMIIMLFLGNCFSSHVPHIKIGYLVLLNQYYLGQIDMFIYQIYIYILFIQIYPHDPDLIIAIAGHKCFLNQMIFAKEEEIEDTIGVIRIRKSSTNRHIHQKTGSKDKVKSTDKYIHQKTRSKVQTTHPPKDRVKSTDNTSTKRQGQKNRQHIHQKTGAKVQTTHPPKVQTNTSTKRQGQKYRQHIHQKTRSKVQTTHPPKDRVKSTDHTSTK